MTKPQPMTITWEKLDECRTPDNIAALLRRAGVRGRVDDGNACPLARATGWRVFGTHAQRGDEFRRLTDPQFRFTVAFDEGNYPELIEED